MRHSTDIVGRWLIAALVASVTACDGSPTGPLIEEPDTTVPTIFPLFAVTHTISATNLGSLGGGTTQVAHAVNNKGRVVGTSEDALGRMRAFYWSAQTGMTDIGTTGGAQARAFDINDNNVVVGWSEDASGNQETYTWSLASGRQALGVFGGLMSTGMGINNKGDIAGFYLASPTSVRGFHRTKSGVFTALPTLGSSFEGWATHLNDAGQVIGISRTSDDPTAAYVSFRWTAQSGTQNLGSMGANFSEHDALRINEFGQAAGGAFNDATQLWHPFIWHSTTGFIDLKTQGFAASRSGVAYGINKFGHVAVLILEPGGTRTPAVWVDGDVIELPNLGGADGEVWDINDLGMIVGWSLTSATAMRAAKWQLVFAPEERVEDVIDALQTIADTVSSSSAQDKLEDVIGKANEALQKFQQSPPKNVDALGALEGAVGDLEAAIKDGFINGEVGLALVEVFVQAARDAAAGAIDAAQARNGSPSKISQAQSALVLGDTLRGQGRFKDAVAKYKEAVSLAESA